MLSKAVCEKCRNKICTGALSAFRWRDIDDITWKNGAVLCVTPKGAVENTQVQKPPDHCGYSLEHLMDAQHAE